MTQHDAHGQTVEQKKEVKRFTSEMRLPELLYFIEIIKGLGVTLRHLLRNLLSPTSMPVISYPEERRAYGPLFRGRHYIRVREDGTPSCVACMMCATVCPARCITIVAEESPNPEIEKRPKSFTLDGLRCVYCGFCVDACPAEAIYMSGEYEMAEYTREACLWDLDFLMNRPSLKKAPPGYRPLE
jgi:NADH-quinone oxidoreductase subunit I